MVPQKTNLTSGDVSEVRRSRMDAARGYYELHAPYWVGMHVVGLSRTAKPEAEPPGKGMLAPKLPSVRRGNREHLGKWSGASPTLAAL